MNPKKILRKTKKLQRYSNAYGTSRKDLQFRRAAVSGLSFDISIEKFAWEMYIRKTFI